MVSVSHTGELLLCACVLFTFELLHVLYLIGRFANPFRLAGCVKRCSKHSSTSTNTKTSLIQAPSPLQTGARGGGQLGSISPVFTDRTAHVTRNANVFLAFTLRLSTTTQNSPKKSTSEDNGRAACFGREPGVVRSRRHCHSILSQRDSQCSSRRVRFGLAPGC
jgi:hypothetical protein